MLFQSFGARRARLLQSSARPSRSVLRLLGGPTGALLLASTVLSGACAREGEMVVGGGGQGGMGGQSQELLAEAIETVGPAGKKIQTTHAKLTIPAGALKKNVQVTVSGLRGDEAAALPATDDAVPALSTPVRFKPHGLSFEQDVDVELTTALDSPKNPVVLKLSDESDDTWELVNPAQFSATGAKFKTRSFSIYRVFDDPQHLAEQIYLPPNGGTGGAGAGGSASAGGASTAGSSAGGASTAGSSAGGQFPAGGTAAGGFVGAGGTFPAGGFPGIGGSSSAGGSGGLTGAGGSGTGGVSTANSVVQVELGDYHSCALLGDGSVKCWGSNASGQLGLGDFNTRGVMPGEMGANLPPVDLGVGPAVQALASGNDFNCALRVDSSVKCWGANGKGQLGLGDTTLRGGSPGQMGDNLPAVNFGAGRSASKIAAGGGVACAILDDGTLKCWGDNSSGQLGQGDNVPRGTSPGNVGDYLPAIDLGTGAVVNDVAVGGQHVCAIINGGDVKCWGNNYWGQLGLGDGNARGDESNEMGLSLPSVDLGTGRWALAVIALNNATCALLDNLQVKCWGDNSRGQLGLGSTIAKVGANVLEMGDYLPALDLGTSGTVTALSAGSNHVCALFDNGLAKCWGFNDEGQLGLGDQFDRGDVPAEMGSGLAFVDLGTGVLATSINGGLYHSCVVTLSMELKCWGNGTYGQLGYEDQVTRGDSSGQMGDQLPFVSLW